MCVALLSGPPSFLYLGSNPLQLPAEKLLKGRKSLRPRALPELQTTEGLNSDPNCIRSCEWTYKSETLTFYSALHQPASLRVVDAVPNRFNGQYFRLTINGNGHFQNGWLVQDAPWFAQSQCQTTLHHH